MAQPRYHYERAIERQMRRRRLPFAGVEEVRRTLLGERGELRATTADGAEIRLKNFDFVVYGAARHLLLEVKGRRLAGRSAGRLDCWVTLDDVASMLRWQRLFGPPFEAVFAFVYWLAGEAAEGVAVSAGADLFEHEARRYAVLTVPVEAYARAMRTRSARWGTVHLTPTAFARLARPLGDPARGTRPIPDEAVDAATDAEPAVVIPRPGTPAGAGAVR